ncbi:MAG: dienelactone hydrolase family protein [Chloroflexota bacterium]
MDDMKSYLVHEFLDEYRAQRMDRRAMLKRVTLIIGGAATASAWLQSQGEAVSAAEAAQSIHYLIPSDQIGSAVTVQENDPAITGAGMVQFPARDGATIFGYAASPAGMATAPSVLIIHENRALLDHYKDVARRFAREGFSALAIDLVSRDGGTDSFADQPSISAALTNAGAERHVVDMIAGIDFLLGQPGAVQGGVGVTGFCFGGSQAWRIAVEDDRVAATVPYYGSAPPLAKVPAMRAAAFGVYASDDERINQSAVPLEEALRTNGKTFMMKQYPGTSHGFFNDTGQRHAPDASREAWSDTLVWFRQYVPNA